MWKVSGMRLLVALVLAGAVSASSNANSGDICDCECCVKPHPTDCTAYYYCEPGHLAEYFKCSEGLVFHPEVRQCVLQVQYPQCQIGSGDNDECDFTCPIAEGLYAHPRDCNKWVYCSNSEAFIKHCPDNLHFDAAKQVCDWPNNVQCTQQPEAACDLVYVEPEPVTPDSGDADSESCDFTCPEQQGMYAHPRDCSKFVSCANSQPSTSSCPPPLVFNAAKKVCDWSDNVQCTSASDAECVLTIVETVTDAPVTGSGVTDGGNDEDCDFVCPEVEGIYAHPRDCSIFVSCANSKPSTSSCPQNLLFNAAKKVCDWSDNVQCTCSSDAECVLTIVETVTDAPVTGSGVTDGGNDEDCDFVCPEVEGIYAHPRDCSKFVSCANSKPSTSSCPQNLLFNAAKKVCDWSDNVQCTSTTDAECVLTIVETITDAPVTGSGVTDGGNDEDCDFVCPEVEGIYAHPRDCSKFVSCANSKPSTSSCPQNLIFNAAKKVCDWSDNVQCTCSTDAECVLTIVETVTDAPVTGSGVTDGGNDEDCDFVCPEVEGIYAHPRDCSKFVSCANSEPSTLSCPQNLIFNAAKKVCDWSNNVQCTCSSDAECVLTIVETITDAPVTGSGVTDGGNDEDCDFVCPEVEGIYAHPRDCSKFVNCANSKPSTLSCPQNLLFNAAKKVCDWSDNVQCTCSTDAECVLTIVETVTDAPVTGSGVTDGGNDEDCDFVCPEVEGIYAHPRDCSKFVSCANSEPSTLSCPQNLIFNAAKKVCDWSDNVQCTSSSDAECVLTIVETITDAPVTGSGVTDGGNDEDCDFVCPEVEGIYAHPRDCSKFVSCANSEPSTLSCPQNLIFNAAKKVCDWSDNVQCTCSTDAECVLTIVETITDAPVTGSGVTDGGNDEDCDFVCPEVEGIYAHPRDCSKFVSCANSEPSTLSCPQNLIFNAAKKVCDWSDNVQCTCSTDAECVLTIVETVTDAPVTGSGVTDGGNDEDCDFVCPEVEGIYAHPRDCSKFVSCANSEPSTLSCPQNLIFNAAKKVCDWSDNVQCTSSSDAECVLTIVETITDAPVTGSGVTDGGNDEDCDFVCPEVEGIYAHPRDCSKFVSCANSEPSTLSCPQNLIFNAAKKVCDWSDNVQCTSTSDAECVLTIVETITDAPVTGSGVTDGGNDEDCDFVCPEVEGIYAHPRDCSKFVSCANSEPSTLSCPQNLIFNAAKKVCDWSDNVQCTCSTDAECVLTIVETVTDAPVTGSGVTDGGNDEDCDFICPEVEGIYAHPRDCTKFVSCANSKPSTSSCPQNLLFNAAKKVCDWSQNVQCTSSSDAECVLTIVETITDAPVTGSGVTDGGNDEDCDFVCPEVEGIYAHPRDCSKFVSCANSKPSTSSCPQNLIFNAAKKVCDWSDNVQCTSSSDAECVLTIVETITDAPVTGSGVTDGGNDEDCDFVCPEVEGIYAHPRDCSKFVSCANSKPSTSSCPQNLLFNAAKKVCDWSQNVQCTCSSDAECVLTIVETITDAPVTGSGVTDGGNDEDCDFVCPEVEGIYAHPRDCSKFVSCANSKPSTSNCPQNLLFNAAKKVCDWSDNVQCTSTTDAECVLTIVETVTDAPVTTPAPTTPKPTTAAPTTPAPTTPEPTTPEPTTPEPTTPEPTTPEPTTPEPTTPEPTTPEPTTPEPTTPEPTTPKPTTPEPTTPEPTTPEPTTPAPTTTKPTLPNPNPDICDCECCTKPHPEDCTSYYYCAPGADAQFNSCSEGLVFHPDFKQCVLQALYPQCQPEVPPTCDPTCECLYPSEICSEYYKCNREGTPIKYECTGGLLYNEAIYSCDLPQNVECSATRRKRSVTYGDSQQYTTAEECKQLEGKFAVRDNPNAYYLCSHGTAHLMRCPDLAVFSSAAQDCIFMK